MHVSELDFPYPEELIAQAPKRPKRVLWGEGSEFSEITLGELLTRPQSEDLIVLNETKVCQRRIFSEEGQEILFLTESEPGEWEVLFPARQFKRGDQLSLPEGVVAELIEKGRPQKLKLSRVVGEEYFDQYGELPLPPYIQKARDSRHNIEEDESWYQTEWAREKGSLAAPTASLHFTEKDWEGVKAPIVKLTLHVGLGTFLPITSEDLNDHIMHREEVSISKETWEKIEATKARGGRVWALGTTVCRALESVAQKKLQPSTEGGWRGETNLFIQPGFDFKVVDVLMTNFHQPKSTLLALVAAFAGLEKTKKAYAWAMERKFKLFSYGDLTVWNRQ